MIHADPRFDPRDPPETSGPDPRPPAACCSDPTPGCDEKDGMYCQSCDAELVPKSWLERARELFVFHATKSQRAYVSDADEANWTGRLQPGMEVSFRKTEGGYSYAAVGTVVRAADPDGATWVIQNDGEEFERPLKSLSSKLLNLVQAKERAGALFDAAIASHAEEVDEGDSPRDEPNPAL